jgi:hypothetical protein
MDAGVSPDGSIVFKKVISHIRDGFHTDGYGIAKYTEREDEQATIVVTLQKKDYNTQIHFEIEDVFGFIDVKASEFPFHQRPRAEDIMQIFYDMDFGKKFDYHNVGKIDGDDFIFNFYVSEYTLEDNHYTYVKTGLKWVYSEMTERLYQKHFGRLVMRFPKGPSVMHDQFHMSFTTMNKGYTFLQHALLQGSTQLRAHMFRAARTLCNPLITGTSGRTALQLLEEVLKKRTKWAKVGVHSIGGLDKVDRGFLRHVRKDHDDMVTPVFRNALVYQPSSILYNEEEKKIMDKSNLRKAKTKARFVSLFHGLPDDVCANIIRFL